MSAPSILDGPALAIVSAQIVVGLQHIGNAHVGAVVVDLFSSAQGDDAQEHDLGETGRVLEGTTSFHLALGGIDPVHFVVFVCDARELLRGLAEGIVEGLGQEPGLETVGVVEELALAADEQRAAFLFKFFVAEFFGFVGLEAAVVPRQFDWRHGTARGNS